MDMTLTCRQRRLSIQSAGRSRLGRRRDFRELERKQPRHQRDPAGPRRQWQFSVIASAGGFQRQHLAVDRGNRQSIVMRAEASSGAPRSRCHADSISLLSMTSAKRVRVCRQERPGPFFRVMLYLSCGLALRLGEPGRGFFHGLGDQQRLLLVSAKS